MNTYKITIGIAVLLFMTNARAAVYLIDQGKKPQGFVVGGGVPALKGWQVKRSLERLPLDGTATDTVVCADFKDCVQGAAAFCERRGSQVDEMAYGIREESSKPTCIATCVDDHLGSAPCKVITSEDIKELASDPATQKRPDRPATDPVVERE